MSNVTHLDATTRNLLRLAISDARRAKVAPTTIRPDSCSACGAAADCRPVEGCVTCRDWNNRREWRKNNRERERAASRRWRKRQRVAAGLPPTRNENVDNGLCAKGLHLLAGENVRHQLNGKRRCRECHREYLRESKRRQRASMTPEQLEAKREAARVYWRTYRAKKREAA